MRNDILKESIFSIPIRYDEEKGFSCAMNSLMLNYERIVKKYGYEEISDNISKFRSYVREMYKLYNKGMHAKAYKKFTTAIKHLGFKNEKLVTELSEREF